MAGYDPTTAPKFVWPERLNAAKADIRNKVEERVKAAVRPIRGKTRKSMEQTLERIEAVVTA